MKLVAHGKMWKYLSISDDNSFALFAARDNGGLDVCKLRWMFIKATFLWIALWSAFLVFSAAVLYAVGDFIAWVAAMLIEWNLIQVGTGAIGIVIVLFFSLIYVSLQIFSMGVKDTYRKIADSDIGVMYSSWREKYCEKVEIVRDENEPY